MPTLNRWAWTGATAPCDRSQRRQHLTIPLAPRTGRTLDLYIDERTTGPIFLGASGQRMDRYAADRTVKRLSKRAGITKRISPHNLRHSFITAAFDTGVPLRDLQEAASTPTHGPQCPTTGPVNRSTVKPPTSSQPSWLELPLRITSSGSGGSHRYLPAPPGMWVLPRWFGL